MCTAITYQKTYFGRNLDVECSYGEQIVITPRQFVFDFRHSGTCTSHYAMIGVAAVIDGSPLYFDAVNECGLAAAGLRFSGNAWYAPCGNGEAGVASFEFINWVLARCSSVEEAIQNIQQTRITDTSFNRSVSASPLHWMVTDKHRSITVEQTKTGLRIWENPVEVLTNNPPFDRMLDRLYDYRGLSIADPPNRFAPALPLELYSRGMGAIGLPGDYSSVSRFVRATFVKTHAVAQGDQEQVSQFFHILDTVAQPRGCTVLPDGQHEFTAYTTCYRLDQGVCYYKTYDNPALVRVDLHAECLDADRLVCYPMLTEPSITKQNNPSDA